MMSALVYARLVHPCSKSRTYDEVIPKLFESYDFSLNQLYDGLEYIGCEYEKVIEIYNHQIQQKYGFDTAHTYFPARFSSLPFSICSLCFALIFSSSANKVVVPSS